MISFSSCSGELKLLCTCGFHKTLRLISWDSKVFPDSHSGNMASVSNVRPQRSSSSSHPGFFWPYLKVLAGETQCGQQDITCMTSMSKHFLLCTLPCNARHLIDHWLRKELRHSQSGLMWKWMIRWTCADLTLFADAYRTFELSCWFLSVFSFVLCLAATDLLFSTSPSCSSNPSIHFLYPIFLSGSRGAGVFLQQSLCERRGTHWKGHKSITKYSVQYSLIRLNIFVTMEWWMD